LRKIAADDNGISGVIRLAEDICEKMDTIAEAFEAEWRRRGAEEGAKVKKEWREAFAKGGDHLREKICAAELDELINLAPRLTETQKRIVANTLREECLRQAQEQEKGGRP
jgi:hypothetical protein